MWRVRWCRSRNVSQQIWQVRLVDEEEFVTVFRAVGNSGDIRWWWWWWWLRRVAWWTRIWWTNSLVKRNCMEHFAHQFDALAKAAVDDDWDRYCIAINQGSVVDKDVVLGKWEVFDDSFVDWRTLAIPNGNDVDSDRRTFDVSCLDCFASSSSKWLFLIHWRFTFGKNYYSVTLFPFVVICLSTFIIIEEFFNRFHRAR